MGTGIVSVLFISQPYQHPVLYYFGVVFFLLNILLYVTAFAISLLRYTLYPKIWAVMLSDPVNSLFLGTVPMGFATLLNVFMTVCVPLWGQGAITAVTVGWVIVVVVSVAVTLGLPMML